MTHFGGQHLFAGPRDQDPDDRQNKDIAMQGIALLLSGMPFLGVGLTFTFC